MCADLWLKLKWRFRERGSSHSDWVRAADSFTVTTLDQVGDLLAIVALMRLVPLVSFNLLNYALGLTRISLPAYVLASLVCMLPGTIAYTWLGYAGRSAVSGDLSEVRYGLLGLGVLAMIAFVPRLFRRLPSNEAAWIGIG